MNSFLKLLCTGILKIIEGALIIIFLCCGFFLVCALLELIGVCNTGLFSSMSGMETASKIAIFAFFICVPVVCMLLIRLLVGIEDKMKRTGKNGRHKSRERSLKSGRRSLIVLCAIIALVFWAMEKRGVSAWSLLWGEDTAVWARILAFIPFLLPCILMIVPDDFEDSYHNFEDWAAGLFCAAFSTFIMLGIAKVVNLLLHIFPLLDFPVEYYYLGLVVIIPWLPQGSPKGEKSVFDDIF